MLRNTITTFLLLCALIGSTSHGHAFCGFYVAGAGATLYNEASQVILARHGSRTVVTMQNDFQGSVKDFALIVPVPVVLQRQDIRIADPGIFARLDAYSAPRLVEYYDENPCEIYEEYGVDDFSSGDMEMAASPSESISRNRALGVTIEARYQVGEYDILILSGKESSGLATWLRENGYVLPKNAEEVLNPYIRDQQKFFVVKVNLEKLEGGQFNSLRPIQISYEHPRFMLPIRLGMANSRGYQDLIIYALTPKGRVETANYRTAEIPSNLVIPLRVKPHFGVFYKALFERAWAQQRKAATFVEYAWDLSSSNFMKCDPCASDPPFYADLKEAGAFWVTAGSDSDDNGWGGQSADYRGELFFTRLHVRYGRGEYPEDLMFVETGKREAFQGRYVLHHPATGDLSCDAGKRYKQELVTRRRAEEANLYKLTGWAYGRIPGATDAQMPEQDVLPFTSDKPGDGPSGPGPGTILLLSAGLLLVILLMPRLLGKLEQRLAMR
jgi:hypothetical protein